MTNEMYEKLSDYYKSVIRTWENDLYLLDRGVRSVCTDFLHYEKDDEDAIALIYELEQMAIRRNLYFSMFDTVSKEDGKIDLAIYAYKYIHYLPLIKYVENGAKGMIREWILGKLLGYSDESMNEYLCRQLVDCFEINDSSNKKDEVVKEEKKEEPNDTVNESPAQEKCDSDKLSSETNEGTKGISDEWNTLFANFVRNLADLEKHLIPPQPNLYTGPNFMLADYIGNQYVFSKVEDTDGIYSIKMIFDNCSGRGLLTEAEQVGFTRIRDDEYRNLTNKYHLTVLSKRRTDQKDTVVTEEKYSLKTTKRVAEGHKEFIEALKKAIPSFITDIKEIEKRFVSTPDLYHGGSFSMSLDNGDCYVFSRIPEFGNFYVITEVYDHNIGVIEPYFIGYANITDQDYELLATQFHVSRREPYKKRWLTIE